MKRIALWFAVVLLSARHLGAAASLYLLSPSRWKTERCGPGGSQAEVREIVAHELVHVFHGQHAPSPEFVAGLKPDGYGWPVKSRLAARIPHF